MTVSPTTAGERAARSVGLVEGMRWLAGLTRRPDAAWSAWQAGRLVSVPAGEGFVAVRVSRQLGLAAHRILQEEHQAFAGPVLRNHELDSIEFFVAPSPAVWLGSEVLRLDGGRRSTTTVACPPLGQRIDGRLWLIPPYAAPGAAAQCTDPHRLARALTLARQRLHAAGYPAS
ncbi:hypothetical protein [Kitasatospora sp. NPDC015120]|uniref:hypothetical protein n=1 Tax=Kitasatospora sp. NPDC015120 TaxID=3364023 RepID=UPI0036F47D0B